jgi:hypothetical protein
MGGHRVEDVGVEAARDLLELARRATRVLEVARGESDLDVRGQQPRSSDRVRRPGECAPHRGGRVVHASLRQAQESESRLRVPAPAARVAVRGLRLFVLASQPMQLRLLVERGSGVTLVEPGDEALAAWRASSAASAQAPSSCRISDRCSRQWPKNPIASGCASHHVLSASVHSRARSSAYTCWQPQMTLQ